jgi:hypothetical protein
MGDIGSVMTDRTIPAVGSSGTAYATSITAFLTEVRQRLEDSIPLSSLEMSALDMANNEITNVNYLRLYEQDDAPTTPVGSLQRYGDNLYWISASGAVQLTDGADINVAGTGGITGDYGLGPEQLRYVDADSTFYAYADFAGGEWARVWARSFDVAGDATGTERIRITWAGTGSSYTLTLPAAVPAALSLLQMDTSGNVLASNAAVTAITMATGEDITLVGTGEINHGTRTKQLSLHPFAATTGSAAFGAGGGGEIGSIYATNTIGYIRLSEYFVTNDSLSQIVFFNVNTDGGTHAYSVVSIDSAGTETVRETISSATSGTVTLTLDPVIAVSGSYLLYMKIATGTGNSTHLHAIATWTH